MWESVQNPSDNFHKAATYGCDPPIHRKHLV
jgi:hypothetical protein